MDLYNLRNLFIDETQLVRIYDLKNDAELIYEGSSLNFLVNQKVFDVSSIDNIYPDNDGYLGINIMKILY